MAEALNHELRAKGVGSSEVAMLIIDTHGKPLSPWGGPHRLWQKKTGQAEPEDEKKKPWLKKGKFLEPAILKWHADRVGGRVRIQPGTKRSRKFPIAVDSVDGLLWDKGNNEKGSPPNRCLEAKTVIAFQHGDWGEEGTDQIPQYYLTQGQWHMGVWELPECDYPMFWGNDLENYRSKFDDELWMGMLDLAERFWRDYVETGKAPPVDIHHTTTDWLAKRLAQLDQGMTEADDEMVRDMLALRELKIQDKLIGDQLQLLENQLKVKIGENKGFFLPGNPKLKITFNEAKGRKFLAVDSMLQLLIPDEVKRAEVKDEFTIDGPPSRRFLATSLVKNEIPGVFSSGGEP